MRRFASLPASLIIAALTALSCAQLKNSQPAAPSDVFPDSSSGWTSSTDVSALAPGQCGGLDGEVTSRSSFGTSARGSATCYGGVTLNGSGQATALGTIIRFTASGTATGPEHSTCPFTASGSATPRGSTTWLLTYTGSSCFGPIGGTSTLTKN